MRAKSIVIGCVLLVVGLVIGVLACTWFLARPQRFFGDIGYSHMLNQFALSQYKQAEYPDNKKGLEQYLLFLGEYQVGKESWLSEETVAFEKLMTHARIALIEEQHGQESVAAEHWKGAIDAAGKTRWRNKDVEHIRGFMMKLEKQ